MPCEQQPWRRLSVRISIILSSLIASAHEHEVANLDLPRGSCDWPRVEAIDLGNSTEAYVHDDEKAYQLVLRERTGVDIFTTRGGGLEGAIFGTSKEDLVALAPVLRNGNFRIKALLPPGVWCIKPLGDDGEPYALHVAAADIDDLDADANTIPGAAELGPMEPGGSIVQGYVDSPDDVDYFRFAGDIQGHLSIHSTGNLDLMGELLVARVDETTGSVVWRDTMSDLDSGAGLNFAFDAPVHVGGAYFVVVATEDGQMGEYELVVSLDTVQGTADTPIGPATLVSIGTVMRSRLTFGGDVHQFAIESQGGVGGLRIFSLGSTDVEATLLDADGEVLAFDDDGGDGMNFLLFVEDRSDTYYLRVGVATGDGGDYEVAVTRQKLVPDESKTMSDAVDVGVGRPQWAWFGTNDGWDVFRLELPQPEDLQIGSEGPSAMAGVLTDKEGRILASDQLSGESRNFRIRALLAAGEYFLFVAPYRGTGVGPYRVSVDAYDGRPAEDDSNVMLLADQPMVVGSRRLGTISPGDDIDFHSVHVTRPSLVTIYTSGDLDTWGNLYPERVLIREPNELPRLPSLAADDDSGDGTNFLIREYLEPGHYFVGVTATTGDRGDYKLAVDGTVLQDDHGNLPEDASYVELATATSGQIEHRADVDYFRIGVPESDIGRVVVVTTQGDLDTVGTLEDSQGNVLYQSDDDGAGGNFRLEYPLPAFDTFVKVESYGSNSGEYTLRVESTPGD